MILTAPAAGPGQGQGLAATSWPNTGGAVREATAWRPLPGSLSTVCCPGWPGHVTVTVTVARAATL